MGAKINFSRRLRITAEMVRAILSYDPVSGAMIWIKPRSNRCKPGDKATTLERGRFTVAIYGARFPASHIAWLVLYGEWPRLEVDHRNRNPLDNSAVNLRLATTAQNCANQVKRKTNTSGFKGVKKHPQQRGWWAKINADGFRYDLGVYPSAELAAGAYRIAAAGMHGEFMGA